MSGAWRLPRRLAYVVSHARPWSSNGYAARTHAMASALTAAGHEVIVFTRPGRPWDIEDFPADQPVDLDQSIDGVRHISLPLPPLPGARPTQRLHAMADALTKAFEVFRPAAVLGASNWETAEPARRAAGRVGAAFFYEQRGFWQMGADPAAEEAERAQETETALGARAVFTLNALMRDELLRRGIPAGRVHLVPNGVPEPGRIDRKVTRESLGCRAQYLLCYIGSLSDYEGVGDLVELVALLRRGVAARAALDVEALILGSDAPKGLIGALAGTQGPAEAALRAQAARLSVGGHIHFLPQLPEGEVASYYTLCDAMVMPRRRTPVTELVPPIKPYAAAAYGLPVFMSDLPPLAEIAVEIGASLFAEGDLAGLADMVHSALTGGHPARMAPLDPNLGWARRILPLSRHLDAVTEAERARNHQMFAPGAAETLAHAAPQPQRFDLAALPRVGLQGLLGAPHEARIGPPAAAGDTDQRITRLTRANLLEVLATAEPGRFVIDWAGLQATDDAGEWAGLWSIDDMRLNRQIMDAVRIALQRGWRLQVLGPVPRSQAPLFRTVASVMEEILPPGQRPPAEGAA